VFVNEFPLFFLLYDISYNKKKEIHKKGECCISNLNSPVKLDFFIISPYSFPQKSWLFDSLIFQFNCSYGR